MAVFSVSRLESLLFLSSRSSTVVKRLSRLHSGPNTAQKNLVAPGICSQELWPLDHGGSLS
jgi:hypothetical protein